VERSAWPRGAEPAAGAQGRWTGGAGLGWTCSSPSMVLPGKLTVPARAGAGRAPEILGTALAISIPVVLTSYTEWRTAR
jgi:hypothetical protein